MTPGPTIQELIAAVQADAASDDALEQLSAASQTVADLEEVADATLAHFVDQCRRSGRSWSEISKALGVTKQAAHKRFSITTPPLERFTPRARAIVPGAAAQALRLNHKFVGTEHILLALFTDAENLAAKVLIEMHVSQSDVEQRILAVTPRGTTTGDDLPFTPRATDCVAAAVAEATQLGHNYVGTEHILLALFADEETLAAEILIQLGATYDDARARVIEKLSGYAPTRRPSR